MGYQLLGPLINVKVFRYILKNYLGTFQTFGKYV